MRGLVKRDLQLHKRDRALDRCDVAVLVGRWIDLSIGIGMDGIFECDNCRTIKVYMSISQLAGNGLVYPVSKY